MSSSAGDGARVLRGTSSGRARTVDVLGVCVMASVAPPDMTQAHLGRITLIDLLEPLAGDDHRAEMEALADHVREHAPALWGRMIAHWPRWRSCHALFRQALANAGCAPRAIDQFGALLASWWVLTHDGEPDERAAIDSVAAIADFTADAEQVANESAAMQVVHHLLSQTVQRDRSTERVPIAELIAKVFRHSNRLSDDQSGFTDCEAAARDLGRHGVRVVRSDQKFDARDRPVPRGAGCASNAEGIWLLYRSAPLVDLFNATPWAGQRWRHMLRGLPGAKPSSMSVRVGDLSGYALWLPRERLSLASD